jgi:hypothetical protein
MAESVRPVLVHPACTELVRVLECPKIVHFSGKQINAEKSTDRGLTGFTEEAIYGTHPD